MDSKELIKSKKSLFLKEGIALKNLGMRTKALLFLGGHINFKRASLVPADKHSAKLLYERYGLKSVVPLEMALGIDRLPFKMSVEMMLDTAWRAINARSYADLQQSFLSDRGITISDDQIRKVVEELGAIVFDYDQQEKNKALENLESREPALYGSRLHNGVLYLEMDGAMLNTRVQKDGSSWRECKLGIAFNSLDIMSWRTMLGKDAQRILKREFISYIGDAETFMAHVYAMAQRNGLHVTKKVVIISDGAKWIKGFKETYCKGLDALHILDFSHLKENVYKFSKSCIRGKSETKKRWAETMAQLLHDGKVDEALAMAKPYNLKVSNRVNG